MRHKFRGWKAPGLEGPDRLGLGDVQETRFLPALQVCLQPLRHGPVLSE